ncbi:hypothetical protein [Burkholderia cepacia]|uniref:hypothetical protein n=1 Tax=Burkholderia cepacia TaxID=292 RepID=UPI001CF2AE99|nr:hypothetical protein [Burkholderia cepacia]MCA8110276.1 hypothetical protein [Burkholderia cepacia]MCA8396575.1 hypothetical protein [Burkholderia cepacia]
MKVKHTQNGNVKITLSLEQAKLLNGLLTNIRWGDELTSDHKDVANKVENALDEGEVDATF